MNSTSVRGTTANWGTWLPGAPGTVIPLTQEVLAEMSGSTRPTTNHVLRSAEEAGLIRVQRGRVRVDDPAGLARRAGMRLTP